MRQRLSSVHHIGPRISGQRIARRDEPGFFQAIFMTSRDREAADLCASHSPAKTAFRRAQLVFGQSLTRGRRFWHCLWLWGVLSVLSVISGAGAAPTPQPSPSDEVQRAQQQLQRVLEQPAFEQWQRRQARAEGGQDDALVPDAWRQWVLDTRDTIFDWVESLFSGQQPQTNPGAGPGSFSFATVLETLAWILIGILVLFVLGVIVRLLAGARAAPKETPVTRQRLKDAMDAGEALAADSGQWLSEAEQLADEADLRRSYRALYLAMLSGLHRAGAIDFRPNRTNWMYVRQFRGQGEQRDRLSQLTRQFDAVWYGRQNPKPDAIQQARQQVEALLNAS
jgi:hypothetical protein